ncbi:MAG: hypothetical protein KAU20_05690 [Nanoarchaeota archaeon]|nr:hypothetical protein [Nanoarchaeota archaeon]
MIFYSEGKDRDISKHTERYLKWLLLDLKSDRIKIEKVGIGNHFLEDTSINGFGRIPRGRKTLTVTYSMKDLLSKKKEQKVMENGKAVFYLRGFGRGYKEYYELKGWKNVKNQPQLPFSYKEKAPYFYELRECKDKKEIYLVTGKDECIVWYLREGQIISKDLWDKKFFPAFEEAGAKLHDILQEKKWSGEIEVRI